MKKTLLFLLACLPAFSVLRSQCSLVITGDFDSECTYDFKDAFEYEYPFLFVACKGATVTYTVHGDNLPTTTSYIWEIFGDASHTVAGDQVTVTWGGGDWGMLVVSAVPAPGDTCTAYGRVLLADVPTAACSTVPAYTVLPGGDKMVYVCPGATVEFIDRSSPGNSDIAGYTWTSDYHGTASTPHFTIDDVTQSDKIVHRVYNNCGCYDEETVWIEVLQGEKLQLDCFGTVCEGSQVTYTLGNPSGCNEYRWYVEGGTLVDGQGTPTPTVLWEHPADGYGVIGLDGNLCGGQACPTLMSVKVPVISDSLSITGQTDVCVGEAVLYSLPLFGSTEYTWTVTPSAGVAPSVLPPGNEARLVFNAPGTYTLECTYRCDFLGCGPRSARPLTVTVNPPLVISGRERVCRTNACSLTLSPAVSASWTVYDLGGGNAVAATATGSSFSHTFSTPGRYLVTAVHPSHCGPATFVLTVADVPPAPTVGDLSPSNSHTACYGYGIALAGTPSNPNYTLVWEPSCTTATPQQFSGDSVTVTYQPDVCDIRVYNYDRELQCQSTAYYVHTVSELTLLPLNIPPDITVCPGSTVSWGPDMVPDQSADGVLYEWSIEDVKQYCASVQGSHLSPNVVWHFNEIQTPVIFYVKLRRTLCGGFTDTIIPIRVVDSTETAVSVTGPDTVCLGVPATFTGSGGTPASYRWSAEDHTYQGIAFSHSFQNEGIAKVTLRSHPYTYCTNGAYLHQASKTVAVSPPPMVQGLSFGSGTVSVVPTLAGNYTYDWSYQAFGSSSATQMLTHGSSLSLVGTGVYCCTVTHLGSGCSTTVCDNYYGDNPIGGCDSMALTGSYVVCSHTLSLNANHYNPVVQWSVEGPECTVIPGGLFDRHADITFHHVGIYTVTATSGFGPCYRGKYVKTVDFIPDFTFEAACTGINIHNRSKYVFPGSMVYLLAEDNTTHLTYPVQIPAGQTSYTFTPPFLFSGTRTFSFTLTGYGTNGNITPCHLADVEIGSVVLQQGVEPVTVTSANGTTTCDNTPIRLTASLNFAGSIRSSFWNFGDGSSFYTDGNSIFHTFEYPGAYNVSVTVVDNRGCQYSTITPFTIYSQSNPLSTAQLEQIGPIHCPHTSPIQIRFTNNDVNNVYTWWRHKHPAHTSGGRIYDTRESDDYFVSVINNNYCQKEASLIVLFPNAPKARIHADNLSCCVGDALRLYGAAGPGTQVTYLWTVTGPTPTQTFTTPDITFSSDTPGTYTVTLTVSSTASPYCSSTATETVTVTTPPAAPTLSFGLNRCIGNAPVNLSAALPSAAGPSSEVHWSNGATGLTADYYTHGFASAYYFDPAIGCRSETGSIRIDREPDFDALLTGCYRKCKFFFPYNLPVYGLTDDDQTVSWDWKYNNTLMANGSGSYATVPLWLPLNSAGSYQLSVDYSGTSCSKTSPPLDISLKNTCDCDSVTVEYSYTTSVRYCEIIYNVTLTVCNLSQAERFCIQGLSLLNHGSDARIIAENLSSGTVPPNDCGTFSLQLQVSSLEPRMLRLLLTDAACAKCTKEFAIDLMPPIGCENTVTGDYSIQPELSSSVAGYFDFDILVGAGTLLAFWSEPPMVLNYSYDPFSGIVSGLGMLDASLLSQLAAAGDQVCFHAVVCENDRICHLVCCFDASDLLQALENFLARASALGDNTTPRDGILLQPNPTTGEVAVVGAADRVVEVLVLDMYGKQLASFPGGERFNIREFASGTYIVRVKTKSAATGLEHVSYHKLVKK